MTPSPVRKHCSRRKSFRKTESMSHSPVRVIRRSILELAPLELECMNVLWRLGEATVRDIHAALATTRPRAYTTIMTILDRLGQKGGVGRQKDGPAGVG